VDNDSLKLDRPASDLKLKTAETFIVVHYNSVVIIPSVDIGSPKLLPSAFVDSTSLRARRDGHT